MSRSQDKQSLEIHGYVGCPFAWRVRLAAAEKGTPADWIPCDVDTPDPRAAAHNPDEHSPLLHHDGFTLLESEIMVQYLEEAGQGRPLMPSEPRLRAELRLLSTRLAPLDAHTEPSKPAARRRSEPGLRLLEAVLADRPFVHEGEPGAVDLTWWPFLLNLHVRGLIDEERFPRVAAYVARIAERPSVQATLPPWASALR